MSMRGWLISGALSVVACATPAGRTTAVRMTPFGEIETKDGEIQIFDRQTGDQRVHRLTVSRDGRGAKVSWADRPGPRTEVMVDTVELSQDERDQIRSWAKQLWELAPYGRRQFPTPAEDGAPAYEWAIVVRVGDEVRVIEGGASSAQEPQPDVIEAVVDFLDMHF